MSLSTSLVGVIIKETYLPAMSIVPTPFSILDSILLLAIYLSASIYASHRVDPSKSPFLAYSELSSKMSVASI